MTAVRMPDVDALAGSVVSDSTMVVVPLGATEQHGPHLPLETDTLIADGVCDRLLVAVNKNSDQQDVRILPAEPVGYSPEHMDFPGSQTLAFAEAIERWIEIGAACANHGVRRIVFMNAHGGNVPIVQIVCQELRVRHAMLAVATKWDRFVKGSGVVSAREEAFGIHGGDIETSVMLTLAPQRVDMNAAKDFPNLQEALVLDHTHLRAYGPHAFGWKMQDLNRLGVTGHSGHASAQKGEALLTSAVDGLTALLDDVERFDLTLLKSA
ncbi:MAG: creatininase family protein [Pseudomonadota bacterium]